MVHADYDDDVDDIDDDDDDGNDDDENLDRVLPVQQSLRQSIDIRW